MTPQVPLCGTESIDRAKAADRGIAVAAQQCGYNDDLTTFERELQLATARIGVKLNGFQDLTKTAVAVRERGIEIVPDSPTEL